MKHDKLSLIGVVRSGDEEESHTECLKTDFFNRINKEFKFVPENTW